MQGKIFQNIDIYFFIYLSFILIIGSLFVLFILNLFVTPERRLKDNEVVGNTSAFVSIIYGMLMSLMSLYLIDNISSAANAVQKEANAVANLYRDAGWLANPTAQEIRKEITNYLNEVIQVEWPGMRNGSHAGFRGNKIIDNISHDLNSYQLKTSHDNLIVKDMLEEIRNLYDSRHLRLYMSRTSLSPQIWVVIFVGTFLSLGINFLFGTRFYLHCITITAAALMCSSMIYLIATLDRPFQGEFIVEPTSLLAVSNFINEQELT